MSQRNNNDDGWLVFILIAAALIAAGIYSLSRWLGADFRSTVQMLSGIALTTLVVGGIGYLVRPSIGKLALGFFSGCWMSFWPILDSWARGGMASDEWHQFGIAEIPWWDAGWFKFVVLAAPVSFLIYLIYDERSGW